MSDILVVNGEILWENDEIYIVKNDEAIKQQAYLRSTCDLGESIFYDDYGSKLFEYLGKPYSESNKALIEAECKEILRKTKGIKEILEVNLFWANIEEQKKSCIFAKYIIEGEEKTTENTFKFIV